MHGLCDSDSLHKWLLVKCHMPLAAFVLWRCNLAFIDRHHAEHSYVESKNSCKLSGQLVIQLRWFYAGPFVYGAIDDAYGGGRTAMKFLMFTPCVCISALYMASYFIFRDDVLGFNKHKK